MRAWTLIAVCVGVAVAGCGSDSGSDSGEEPDAPVSDAQYGRALQRACQPIATALKRADVAVLATPENTLVDDPGTFDREVDRAVAIFMDAVDASYVQVAAVTAPPGRAALARTLRADRGAVRIYTLAIRRAAAANDSASGEAAREPVAPRALRRPLPDALARAAPACRRLFPIDG